MSKGLAHSGSAWANHTVVFVSSAVKLHIYIYKIYISVFKSLYEWFNLVILKVKD